MNITQAMQGKTIDVALTDGKELIIRCTDHHEYVIGFENGPFLKSVNVRMVLPMPNASVSAVGL